MAVCMKCEREISLDEIGLYKKMINRGAKEFMCKDCLAKFLEIKPEILDKKIEEFRAMGCTLFAPKD